MFNFLRKTALWIVLTPLAFTLGGVASNQIVLIANHDTFPVEVNTYKEKLVVAKARAEWDSKSEERSVSTPLPEGMLDDTHCVMTHYTHLNFLADVFDLKDGIYSIGDFGIMLGEWLWTFCPFMWLFEVVRKLRQ